MASIYDLKIFKLNRLRFEQLWNDAINWVKTNYNATGEQFTMSSPFALLLSVVLHLGRMIFYYIEDAITGLNIKTAYRPDQIRGLARLSGHNAGRAIAARGSVKIVYYDTGNIDLNGQVCFIPNKTKLLCQLNGSTYTVLFGADSALITLIPGNFIWATIIQGTMKYLQATSSGLPLLTFNFAERTYADIDEYFINVYVNGRLWDRVDSLLDMGYLQLACVVKTGINGGIDVIFGNGKMGKIPPEGAVIYIEYIVTDGAGGNLPKSVLNQENFFEFTETGYLKDGSEVSLKDNFRVYCDTDVIFGSAPEDLVLTLLIAPHASRSFVLANDINYRYFFKRMNMFKTIEIVKGYTLKELNYMAHLNYDVYNAMYKSSFTEWQEAVSVYGEQSTEAQNIYKELNNILNKRNFALQQIEDTNLEDNTVYLLLIPDLSKRISTSSNYFTCDETLFTLTEEEQNNIINLIDNSGLKIITVENKILQPKIARFSINALAKIWEGYNSKAIYATCLNVLSNYLLYFNRKDIIPISDIVALFEKVDGIDSVKVWFDADIENQNVYSEKGFYGIDEYGDIVLTRKYQNINGNSREVRDILPILRGGFTSPDGIVYTDDLNFENLSGFNLTIIEYTLNNNLTLENYQPITQ